MRLLLGLSVLTAGVDAVGGAVLVLGANGTEEDVSGLEAAYTSAPTKGVTPDAVPDDPSVTDTGVLVEIARDLMPAEPGGSPPPLDWFNVTCEADARVYLGKTGIVTEVGVKGRRVEVSVGEQVATEADYSNLPYLSMAVHRDDEGQLQLGYRRCLTQSGEEVPMASPGA